MNLPEQIQIAKINEEAMIEKEKMKLEFQFESEKMKMEEMKESDKIKIEAMKEVEKMRMEFLKGFFTEIVCKVQENNFKNSLAMALIGFLAVGYFAINLRAGLTGKATEIEKFFSAVVPSINTRIGSNLIGSTLTGRDICFHSRRKSC